VGASAQTGLALGAIRADTHSIIVFMAVAAATMSPALLKWSFRAVLTSDPATETSEVSGDNLW